MKVPGNVVSKSENFLEGGGMEITTLRKIM